MGLHVYCSGYCKGLHSPCSIIVPLYFTGVLLSLYFSIYLHDGARNPSVSSSLEQSEEEGSPAPGIHCAAPARPGTPRDGPGLLVCRRPVPPRFKDSLLMLGLALSGGMVGGLDRSTYAITNAPGLPLIDRWGLPMIGHVSRVRHTLLSHFSPSLLSSAYYG